MSRRLHITTVSKFNPLSLGWGAKLDTVDKTHLLKGSINKVQRKPAELQAMITILSRLPVTDDPITVTTSSHFVYSCMTQFLPLWIERNWYNSKGAPIKLKSYWQELVRLHKLHNVTWEFARSPRDLTDILITEQLAERQVNKTRLLVSYLK